MKRFNSSLILLIVGGLIVKTQIIFGDGCQGFPDGLLFFFLCIAYLFLLIVFVGSSVIKYFKKKERFNYLPLLTTVIIAVVIYLAFHPEKFESQTTLFATTTTPSHRHGECSLSLRENQTFKIEMQEIEWACFYKGNYEIKNDTLTLLRQDLQTKTDSVFGNKYLIDRNKKTLLPLDNLMQDTTRWLAITDDTNETADNSKILCSKPNKLLNIF